MVLGGRAEGKKISSDFQRCVGWLNHYAGKTVREKECHYRAFQGRKLEKMRSIFAAVSRWCRGLTWKLHIEEARGYEQLVGGEGLIVCHWCTVHRWVHRKQFRCEPKERVRCFGRDGD